MGHAGLSAEVGEPSLQPSEWAARGRSKAASEGVCTVGSRAVPLGWEGAGALANCCNSCKCGGGGELSCTNMRCGGECGAVHEKAATAKSKAGASAESDEDSGDGDAALLVGSIVLIAACVQVFAIYDRRRERARQAQSESLGLPLTARCDMQNSGTEDCFSSADSCKITYPDKRCHSGCTDSDCAGGSYEIVADLPAAVDVGLPTVARAV